MKIRTGCRQITFIIAISITMLMPCVSCKKKESAGGSKNIKGKRPVEWAVRIEKAGLPNFHKVTDDLYRGAQPSEEGIATLKNMGIKTIINLRAFHCDKDEKGNVKIDCNDISFKTWHPEEEDIVDFIKVVTNKEKTPVFVHCQHGADRTGMMCAIYRVVVCGWTKEQALDEMANGGFGFHGMWQNLIEYSMKLDIEKIKKEAGLTKSQDNKNS
jgi:protein tyrosine/serine phosphatase